MLDLGKCIVSPCFRSLVSHSPSAADSRADTKGSLSPGLYSLGKEFKRADRVKLRFRVYMVSMSGRGDDMDVLNCNCESPRIEEAEGAMVGRTSCCGCESFYGSTTSGDSMDLGHGLIEDLSLDCNPSQIHDNFYVIVFMLLTCFKG